MKLDNGKVLAVKEANLVLDPPPKAVDVSKLQLEDFELVEGFRCRPKQVFECFTDLRSVMGITQGAPATIEPRKGGKFSFYDNNIEGTFTEFEPDTRLVMAWRTPEFPDGYYSKVEIELSIPDEDYDIVRMDLKHTGVPADDKFGNHDFAKRIEAGWSDRWFVGIHKGLGYAKVDKKEL